MKLACKYGTGSCFIVILIFLIYLQEFQSCDTSLLSGMDAFAFGYQVALASYFVQCRLPSDNLVAFGVAPPPRPPPIPGYAFACCYRYLTYRPYTFT